MIGGLDKGTYERLKKTNPSYTDLFELLDIGLPGDHDDLIAKIRRASDGQVFDFGLSFLRTADEADAAYTTLNDYSIWHCNY